MNGANQTIGARYRADSRSAGIVETRNPPIDAAVPIRPSAPSPRTATGPIRPTTATAAQQTATTNVHAAAAWITCSGHGAGHR